MAKSTKVAKEELETQTLKEQETLLQDVGKIQEEAEMSPLQDMGEDTQGEQEEGQTPQPPTQKGKSMEERLLHKLPLGLESIVAKDLHSINAHVDLEENESLALGTILISEDFGANFKKCPNADISTKTNIKLAMLKDDVFANGIYGILTKGEITLSGDLTKEIHTSAVQKAFLQDLIINIKE